MESSGLRTGAFLIGAVFCMLTFGAGALGSNQDGEGERDLPYFFFDWDEVRAADEPPVATLAPGPAGTCAGHVHSHVRLGPGESGVKSVGLVPVRGEPCVFEARAAWYQGAREDAYRAASGVPILGGTAPVPCVPVLGCQAAGVGEPAGGRTLVGGTVRAHWPGPSFK